jgi:hypothetical protein
MSRRKEFSAEVKRSGLARAKDAHGVPRCECHRVPNFPTCGGAPLVTGNIVHEHIDPWEFSRDSSADNHACLTRACAERKTKTDWPAIAKSTRIRDRHFGTGTPVRRPMACGRLSRWSKPIGAFRPQRRMSQVARTRAYLATLPPRRGEQKPGK